MGSNYGDGDGCSGPMGGTHPDTGRTRKGSTGKPQGKGASGGVNNDNK